jgi:hypothetical protein
MPGSASASGWRCAVSATVPAVLMGISRLGYRGAIGAKALSSLVAHAQEHGLETVLLWIEQDPGLLLVPSWQFFCLS